MRFQFLPLFLLFLSCNQETRQVDNVLPVIISNNDVIGYLLEDRDTLLVVLDSCKEIDSFCLDVQSRCFVAYLDRCNFDTLYLKKIKPKNGMELKKFRRTQKKNSDTIFFESKDMPGTYLPKYVHTYFTERVK